MTPAELPPPTGLTESASFPDVQPTAGLFTRLRGSHFVRNTGALASAAVLTQVVSILTAPILARLYGPGGYGTLGMFMTVSNLLGVVAALQVPRIILLPADDRNAASVFRISLLLAAGVSTALLVVFSLLQNEIAQVLGVPALAPWMPFVPVAVFSGGAMTSLTFWANRRGWYRTLSASRVVVSLLASAVSITMGFAVGGTSGLIVGFLVSQVAAALFLAAPALRHDVRLLGRASAWRMRAMAKRYRPTALASVPGILFFTLLQQVPIYLLAPQGLEAVGYYNMTERLLGIPTALIGASVAEVFQQRASEAYQRTGSFRSDYVRIARSMAVLGILPLAVVLVAGPFLFRVFLGASWEPAGHLAQILAVSHLFRLVAGPLYCAFFVTERNREMMLAQGGFLIAACVAMGAVNLSGGGYVWSIAAYSAVSSAMALYFIVRGYALSTGTVQWERP